MENFSFSTDIIGTSEQPSACPNHATAEPVVDRNRTGIAMRRLASSFGCWAAQVLRGPVPDWARRQRQRSFVDGRKDVATPVIHEALSDEGPHHRLTDEEARRHVVFAYIYYGFLAVALLVMLIWH